MFNVFLNHGRNSFRSSFRFLVQRQFCRAKSRGKCESGVLCDIDGVLLRGRRLIRGARKSIKLLYDNNIPVVFLTNQVLQLEEEKAANLSSVLDVEVKPEQVVLSHSPLHRLPKNFLEKFVLVVGQQNIQATANSKIGFKNICSIDDIRDAYPLLDMMDKKRRSEQLDNVETPIGLPNVEGIVFLGEPIKWECVLQLCLDLLVSNGNPSRRLNPTPREHIPVVACNTDLMWMAEAPLPRFGHGAFLLCLESLYKQVTGNELEYKTITGKPFLVTFKYAEKILKKYFENTNGREMSKSLKRIYMIGDNLDTDIYGGKLYKEYVTQVDCRNETTVRDVISILVETGVHNQENVEQLAEMPSHLHRDIVLRPEMRSPDHSVPSITDAVKLIIEREGTN